MNKRTLLFGAVGAGLLGAGGYWAWHNTAHRAPSAALVAQPAAGVSAALAIDTAEPAVAFDFYALTLPDLAGQSQALSQYQGKPLVVNFWATWCAPCVKEMPELDQLARQHPAVQFLGIGIDTAANMQAFTQKIPVSYPLLVAGYEGTDLLRALGNSAGGLPFTVVFGPDGQMNRRVLGEVEMGDLARVVKLY